MIAKSNQLTAIKLVDAYYRGIFTRQETGMRLLMLIDPEQPDTVMSTLPSDLLEEIQAYPDDYDPVTMKSFCIQMCTGPVAEEPLPTIEQVAAARNWIEQHGQS